MMDNQAPLPLSVQDASAPKQQSNTYKMVLFALLGMQALSTLLFMVAMIVFATSSVTVVVATISFEIWAWLMHGFFYVLLGTLGLMGMLVWHSHKHPSAQVDMYVAILLVYQALAMISWFAVLESKRTGDIMAGWAMSITVFAFVLLEALVAGAACGARRTGKM